MVITEVCGTSVFGSIPSQGTKKMSKENKLTPGLPQGFEDRWNKKLLLKKKLLKVIENNFTFRQSFYNLAIKIDDLFVSINIISWRHN